MHLEDIQKTVQKAERLQIIGAQTAQKSSSAPTIEMTNYGGIAEYFPEELVMTVRAGTTISTIQKTLGENAQTLPFFIERTDATIGGAFAVGSADLRDAVLGVKIIDGLGRLLNFGGQVMKNVAGYDVARLLVGSSGKFAVITEISLRVAPENLAPVQPLPKRKIIPSDVRTNLEKGLKRVFDPKRIFI